MGCEGYDTPPDDTSPENKLQENYDAVRKFLYKIMQKIVAKKTAVCKNGGLLTTKGSEMLT